ncbi:DegV family protein [Paenibacillus beijingensis]|uniref:DegV family protein n=1 Tax=Paenibacillus beijingensis TaxID=1126833 RepID=A0A0D5NMG3_9BACL|nr:DegV family protein [Paenibacillus beijingensis]AJY76466.1 hypothetical protein VN24_20195 [Paenibacillus beijingensis]
MPKIIIVTDSTSDIPKEVRERLGIEMVPLKVMFGYDAFLDNITIGPEQFYEKLQQYPELPTTSQPSPADFMAVYERLLEQQPEASIISIHISSQFSGTFQSALLAHSMLERAADITVVDSKSASYGAGLLVVRAAEMAAAGSSKDEILQEIDRLRNEMGLYFLVDTLEYLQKGGRIGRASALVGSILNIKPIMTIDKEGVVTAVDKVRGSKKAMHRIVALLKEQFGNEPVTLVIAWTSDKTPAMELYELIKNEFAVHKVITTTIGPAIGTHVGPGTSAVFMYRV